MIFSSATTGTTANLIAPEIQVSGGSFNGGGATTSHGTDTQNSYEFQNYTSVVHGAHFLRFGVRIREQTEDSLSPANFNGTFTFTGGLGPALDSNNQPVLDASGEPVMIAINSIEQYRRTLLFQSLNYSPALIRSLGGGASQFTLAAGQPGLSVGQFDISPFFGDEWKIRPNLSLSLGLRFETQTNIHDYRDFAPRIALAWAPGAHVGKPPKTVLRPGVGIFYDRFALANVLAADRFNGIVQQQFVVNNPDFYPTVPSLSTLSGIATQQPIQKIDSNLRAPYVIQSALTLELGSCPSTTRSRSLHHQFIRAAPFPVGSDPRRKSHVPDDFRWPLQSESIHRQHQFQSEPGRLTLRLLRMESRYERHRRHNHFPCKPAQLCRRIRARRHRCTATRFVRRDCQPALEHSPESSVYRPNRSAFQHHHRAGQLWDHDLHRAARHSHRSFAARLGADRIRPPRPQSDSGRSNSRPQRRTRPRPDQLQPEVLEDLGLWIGARGRGLRTRVP